MPDNERITNLEGLMNQFLPHEINEERKQVTQVETIKGGKKKKLVAKRKMEQWKKTHN